MRLRVPGWIAWAVAAVAALVVALLVLVHTPPAARWSRDWVVRQVAEAWQLDLATNRVDYNLYTGRVSFDDVRLAAPGHAEAPFFAAARVTGILPWSIVRGPFRLTRLEIEAGRVLLVRENGVLVNLPPSSGAPPPETARLLDLRGLQVRGLDVDYVDRTGDVDVQVRDLRAELDTPGVVPLVGTSGPITAASIMTRIGERATTSGAVSGRMSFDGSNLFLETFTAPFPEATVVADGRINRVLDDVRFALTLAGSLDLAAIAAWTPPPVPVSGRGTFTGTFSGPLGGYELRATFGTPQMTIARVPEVTLAGVLTLTSPRAVIEPLTITTPPQAGTPRRGVFDGAFVYQFGDPGGSDLTGSYRDFDLDMALALYDQDPVTAAAWEQGTVRLGRDSRTAPLRMHATGRSTPLARADRVALDGTWDATLAREQWFVRHDHRVLDTARVFGTAQWPAGGELSRTAITGPLTLDISNVGPAVTAARRSGIGMSATLVDLKGTAHGDLRLGGTLERTLVTGRVESSDLVLPTGAAATASADLVYDEESLAAPAFVLDTAGARVTGHARMGMVSSRLDGAFVAAIGPMPTFLVPFLAAGAPALPVTGTMAIAGTIGGTTDVPDVPMRVQSTPLTYDTRALGTLEGEARLVGTELRIDHLVLDQGPGHLRASGRVDYESYAYDATIDGRGLTWARPVPGAEVDAVSVDVTFAGAGTLAVPGGSGTLLVTPSGGVSDLVGAADLRWQFVNGTAAISALLPKLRAFAQATVEPTAPYAFRGTALVSRLDVQPLALTAGALEDAVTGTVGFSSTFEGRLNDLATSTAFVNLQDLDLTVGGLPLRLERPARVTLRADDFTVDDLALRAGTGTTLNLGGRFRDALDQPLRASFAGDVGDVVALARAFGAVPEGTTATGAVTASWESRGSLANARSTVTVANGTIAVDGFPPIAALMAGATFDGSTLAVEQFSAQWQDGMIAGTARVPRELLETGTTGAVARPGRVDLKVTGLTERALTPWLPAASLASMSGRVSATLGLDLTTATLTGVQGTLVLDEASVTASGVPISQSRPGYMSIADGVLRFDDVEFSAGVPVSIGGTISFTGATELGVWITGTPGLRPFSVLSPAMAVDGAANVDLWITGPPSAPRVTGRVDLDDAELVMRDPRVIASDITGPLIFEGNRISIPGLTGFLNGGSLEASGAVTLTGLTPTGGEVTFQARGVAVEYPRNVDSEIDALLVFSPGPAAPMLRGDVRVLRSSYRATISVPALLAFNATSVVAVAQPSYLDGVRLDVALSTEDDMIIDNNYGRFEAGANVRLQGTVARPGVTGRAELREGGEIFLLNNVYRLNASGISFTNPAAIEPDMNISMVTQQNGEVTVTLSGTLNRLQTNVTSTNPDANTDLLNVLIGGNKTLDGAGAAQLFSGELLGVTGRALGLDALRIERGFETDFVRDPGLVADIVPNPDARLTLSKRLRSDVEVILSRRLSGSGDVSAVVSYRPWRGVELRGSSLDNNDRAFGVRHELSFGGGSTPASTRPKATTQVAATAIEGASPDDEPALRGELTLTAGKRFDFIAWREDTERLQSWYRARGFLEARVRASRTPDAGDGRIGLTYAITRGPHTELRVTGTEVSKRLRRELERAWSDGVFDGFRTDEIRGAVAYDLVRRDVIGGRVEAVVTTPAEGEKVIAVTVQGGEKVTSRTIAFAGVASLTTDDLEAALRARGLNDYVWMDPTSGVEPLQSRYAESGFRAAAVTPSLPRVEAGRAVLSMTIVEGPLTTTRALRVSGVSDDFTVAVDAIAHPLEGRAYREVQVDEAVRRIEALYQAKGYNNVAVTPTVAIADEHFADVSMAVSPGRQQVLQDVVVDGRGRTKPSAVISALRLEPGTPADLTKWAEARKRIYDTNVFRQVDVVPEVVPGAQPDGTEAVRARVRVTEWPAWRLRYGLQLNDTAEPQLDANGDFATTRAQTLGVVGDLQNRNVFGRAFTFGLYGRAERRLQSSSAYLTFPTLFGRAVQTNVFGSRVNQDQFLTDSPEPSLRRTKDVGSIEQRIRRGRALEIAYGYRLSHEVQRPLDPLDPFLLDVQIGHFTSSLFVDRRDDPFNATRGWFASISAERLSLFASDSDSVKLLSSYYHYQPLGRFTAASAVRAGMSFVDPLLFSERFFAGGADTVRGYAQNTLGPQDFGRAASGGNALLVLNQELRAPLYKWLKGVVFVDAGNVYLAKRPTFSDLQIGYGAGIRLDTPFSILRVDFAVPGGGGTRRWYIGIGQIF